MTYIHNFLKVFKSLVVKTRGIHDKNIKGEDKEIVEVVITLLKEVVKIYIKATDFIKLLKIFN